jgi:hypothetical protein
LTQHLVGLFFFFTKKDLIISTGLGQEVRGVKNVSHVNQMSAGNAGRRESLGGPRERGKALREEEEA